MKGEEYLKQINWWSDDLSKCQSWMDQFQLAEALEDYADQETIDALETAIENIITSCNYYEKEVKRWDYSGGFKKSILLISKQIEIIKTKNDKL